MAEDLATLQAQLAAARLALHQLAIGSKAEDVSVDGKRVSYTPASADGLRVYIADLQSRIILAGGTCADGGRRRQARSFYVGH